MDAFLFGVFPYVAVAVTVGGRSGASAPCATP